MGNLLFASTYSQKLFAVKLLLLSNYMVRIIAADNRAIGAYCVRVNIIT